MMPEDSICCCLFESCLHSGMRGRNVVREAAFAVFFSYVVIMGLTVNWSRGVNTSTATEVSSL